MFYFLFNTVFWTLAIYGLIEIIKTLIYSFTYISKAPDGIYMIIGTKNQESKIEGFLRSYLFKILYGKEDYIKDIIIADLDSEDETMQIAEKIAQDNQCIKVVNWNKCKDIIDNLTK